MLLLLVGQWLVKSGIHNPELEAAHLQVQLIGLMRWKVISDRLQGEDCFFPQF